VDINGEMILHTRDFDRDPTNTHSSKHVPCKIYRSLKKKTTEIRKGCRIWQNKVCRKTKSKMRLVLVWQSRQGLMTALSMKKPVRGKRIDMHTSKMRVVVAACINGRSFTQEEQQTIASIVDEVSGV